MISAEQGYTSKQWQECNWLQALEGGIDSSHVSWLHFGGLKGGLDRRGTPHEEG